MQLPSPEQKLFYEQAASQYQSDLAADTSAQAYLMGRGVGPEAAATFRLGVVRRPLLGHETFTGRLCIPYLTPGGVVTFAFRCLQQHSCKEAEHPKYRAPEAVERTLYNVGDFKKDSPAIHICEGELDALTLSMCGFPAIAVPGVSQWKEHFTRCFQDYPQIFVVADGDDAGHKLARFLSAELGARSLRPPAGEDCNSLYVKGGADAIRQWLSRAITQ